MAVKEESGEQRATSQKDPGRMGYKDGMVEGEICEDEESVERKETKEGR